MLIQRRHQKLIEGSFACHDTDLRDRMSASALGCGVNYANAGTIEFLFSDNKYYFMK
jgi:acetyl/propionyl-CoA carboxylase alpha subunit